MRRGFFLLPVFVLSINLLAFNQMEYAKKQDDIVVIKTDYGTIQIAMFKDKAPRNVQNIIKLVKEGFYNGSTFHRVIPGFVIQGGDPNTKDNDPSNDGYGGPGYYIEDEFSKDLHHLPGTIAMAKAKPDQNGSQFYICLDTLKYLDGKYTIVGQLIEGMDVVFKISQVKTDKKDRPIKDVIMKKVYLREKERK